jgi:hypothetical protein
MDFLEKNDLLDETSRISEQSKGHLSTLAQWLNIAAIVSFVGLGLSVIQIMMPLFRSNTGYRDTSNFVGEFITIGISLLLNITLFNAAKFLKTGLDGSDQSYFNVGIRNLNKYFKIMGILFIILLVFFVLAIIIGIFAAAVGGFGR